MTNTARWMFALVLCSCADGTSGTPPMEPVAGEQAAPVSGQGAPMTAAAGFEATVMPLVTEACNCHQTEPILMAPFSLKVGEAYSNLVDVTSAQQPAMKLVVPGSLNDSYLWHKLNNTQLEVMGSGLQMPSTIPLNSAELEVFGRWIADGAAP